ncbi:N-acetylmuramoyl-L-alanine amidase [uncultured Ilyobacter sp.]|uniref:N-acetylmuramoyl-L-alanine amidase n=1 Tax=uncultured Ilyobacter sp. TaxID=544433 RepID=UPI002AA624AF|nr:N-acetylmuramoyl-L-alanine amidase [uncultured Ilyobacter sp.]
MKRIVLVPGHSSFDPGAINKNLNLKEYDCVLEMALKLFKSDDLGNVDMILKRRNSYQTLAEEINSLNPDYIFELHLNAANGKAQGTEVLYCSSSKKGKNIAEILQNNLVKALSYPDRGIKSIKIGDRGSNILWKTKAPCVIVESCFIDSLKFREDLKMKETISALKEGIREIIDRQV